MHYVIDGYNFGYSVRLVGEGRNDAAAVVGFLRNSSALTNRANEATVVFDGAGKVADAHRIKVIFSCGREADEVIKERLESVPRGKRRNYTAVTDDRSLAAYCRSLGVRAISAAKFTAIPERKSRKDAQAISEKPCTISEKDRELLRIFEKEVENPRRNNLRDRPL
jgi:predicted RNA-binding protein with PIN domain